MKKLVLALVFLSMLASATAFTASMTPVKTSASPGSPAVYQIEVENNGTQIQRYVLNHEFSKTGWLYYESSKQVQPGQKATFNVTVTPGESAIQQSYNLKVSVIESSSGDTKSFSDIVKVQREDLINVKEINYSRTSVNPGETVKTSITLQNLASRIISDYRISSSMEGTVRETPGIPFAPGALKTYTFGYSFPKDSSPGNRTLKVWVQYRENYQNFSQNIHVNEVRNITRSEDEVNRGLYVSGSTSISNNGNSQVNISEEKVFPTYIDPILSFNSPPSETVENGTETTYTWRKTLEPGEEVTIEYEINYWVPLALAALILLGIMLLRNLTGNVVIAKKKRELDASGRYKISIEIENRSSNAKDVIKVEDFVPNVLDLDEDFEMTEPDLRRTTDGIKLNWSLEDFKPGEKRVITYDVEQKVEVEEGINLPPAKIVENGKTVSKSD